LPSQVRRLRNPATVKIGFNILKINAF